MKARIIEYDFTGKIFRRWDAEVYFADSERGMPICVDWARKDAKTRYIEVYIPINIIFKLISSRFIEIIKRGKK